VSASEAASAAPEESFGDMALRENLYAALGVMSAFLGPYGRVWEVGVRLKGETLDEAALARRMQSRVLWHALLQGDFGYGKGLCDADLAERLVFDSPSDAVLLVALLLIGGFSNAADRLSAQLSAKRKGTGGITTREATLLRALRDALYGNDDAALATIYGVAAEASTNPVINQVAMVLLFHAYRAGKDMERARGTANAIWAAAEVARQNLEAMGVRPLGRDMSLPKPAKAGVRDSTAREKVAATR
jgi:hypothetical protein